MRTFLFLLPVICLAQEFDVASIKVAAPPGADQRIFIGAARGGPGTEDPTHINWTTTLSNIAQNAYGIRNYQLNAPDWFGSERYEFSVVVPEGATKEQVSIMWRNLLAQRFGMKVRMEKKQFDVEELVVGPRGHKLVESADQADAPPPDPSRLPPPGPPKLDKNGRPELPTGAGMLMMMTSGPTGIKAQMVAKARTTAQLADMLSNQMGHPVVDKTGLTKKYDFNLDYTPSAASMGGIRIPPPPPGAGGGAGGQTQGPAPVAEVGVDLDGAIQQQLGLRLNKAKGNLDYIIVEQAQKTPTEN